MNNNTPIKNLLIGRQAIMDYTGLSKYLYLKWVKKGMPVYYDDDQPMAHKENLDEFFKAVTRTNVNAQKVPDEIINADSEDKK